MLSSKVVRLLDGTPENTKARPRDEIRGHTRHPARHGIIPRTDLTRRSLPENPPIFYRACHWILPWSPFSYPGHIKGLLAILGDACHRTSLQNWKQKGCGPPWAHRCLAAYIRARCAAGLALADELDRTANEKEVTKLTRSNLVR
jgi:hypothetical protein